MESQIYIAVSQQDALSRQMDVIANNIANMNTTGFKAQNATFASQLQGSGQNKTAYVRDGAPYRDMSEGAIQKTGNPLDVAIKGNGWFEVLASNGQQEYTRAGDFQMDQNGQIVTANGNPVLDSSGSPISIPQGSKDITINGDGSVATETGTIATLGIVKFDDDNALQAQGDSLYSSATPGQPATDAHVMQGVLESSNVQPVLATTEMMDVLRNYEMAENLTDDEHQRITSMIEKLGQN